MMVTVDNPCPRHGTALIVSGPSGAGKTTVCRQLLQEQTDLHFSVSCTTRAPRAGEQDGVDYYFLSREVFCQRLEAGDFLEHAEVHGNLYGTLREEVERCVNAGRDVLLDIDVQGARQVREQTRETSLAACTVFVFFAPPSFEEMEKRLRGRNTDSDEVIARRLANSKREMAAWREYDYVIINDSAEIATKRLQTIMAASHLATVRTLAPDEAPFG